MRRLSTLLLLVAAPIAFVTPAPAQPPSPEALQARQREAMTAFVWMEGVWRGPAWAITPEGRMLDCGLLWRTAESEAKGPSTEARAWIEACQAATRTTTNTNH